MCTVFFFLLSFLYFLISVLCVCASRFVQFSHSLFVCIFICLFIYLYLYLYLTLPFLIPSSSLPLFLSLFPSPAPSFISPLFFSPFPLSSSASLSSANLSPSTLRARESRKPSPFPLPPPPHLSLCHSPPPLPLSVYYNIVEHRKFALMISYLNAKARCSRREVGGWGEAAGRRGGGRVMNYIRYFRICLLVACLVYLDFMITWVYGI